MPGGAIATPDLFESWLKDTEAIAVGRLVYSRQAGVLASAGMTGGFKQDSTEEPKTDVQFDLYFNGGLGTNYEPYKSQVGF